MSVRKTTGGLIATLGATLFLYSALDSSAAWRQYDRDVGNTREAVEEVNPFTPPYRLRGLFHWKYPDETYNTGGLAGLAVVVAGGLVMRERKHI